MGWLNDWLTEHVWIINEFNISSYYTILFIYFSFDIPIEIKEINEIQWLAAKVS